MHTMYGMEDIKSSQNVCFSVYATLTIDNAFYGVRINVKSVFFSSQPSQDLEATTADGER
jgi:hypothetical protein